MTHEEQALRPQDLRQAEGQRRIKRHLPAFEARAQGLVNEISAKMYPALAPPAVRLGDGGDNLRRLWKIIALGGALGLALSLGVLVWQI